MESNGIKRKRGDIEENLRKVREKLTRLETEWTKDVTAWDERQEARLERERLAAEAKATLLAAERAAEEKRLTEEAAAKE